MASMLDILHRTCARLVQVGIPDLHRKSEGMYNNPIFYLLPSF